MPAAQDALLRVLGHVGYFAGEFRRGAHVDQRLAIADLFEPVISDVVEDIIAKSPEFGSALRPAVCRQRNVGLVTQSARAPRQPICHDRRS